ncbi:MAG: MOSC domain-containing protein [Deltaproteobacteria bacterium]|nr:MOSC domain-containing protein [Deltaproteobacteria bacterium]
MIVESLHVHPLKSGRAIDLGRATVTPLGLAGDRELMVVDAHGRFLTQRGHPRLALVAATIAAGRVTLGAPERRPITAPIVAGERAALRVEIWGEHVDAVVVDPALDAWMSAWLGVPAHVVRFADGFVRPADPAWAAPGDVVGFADGFALLVTGTASLDALNAELERPVTMSRFRPNLVVRTSEPWVEDTWRRIRVGAVELELVKPCGRCVMINVEQATGVAGREPLRTLTRSRTLEHRGKTRVVFGQNAVPRGVGDVHVGDPVVVLEA